MRFQVPQFIETETKLVGPFTLKQFLFIVAGAAIVFLLRYVFSSVYLWVIFSLPIAALAFALAFYKIDNVPLPRYIIRAFSFLMGGKKYMYKKDDTSEIDKYIN